MSLASVAPWLRACAGGGLIGACMPFGTWFLVTATLAAPSASGPAATPILAVDLNASVVARSAGATDQRATSTTPQQAERPHQFGIGGSITASTRGAAGDVRYWFNDHIGLNMTAGWYRSYYETPSGQRPTTVHVSPSVIYHDRQAQLHA